MPSALSPTSFAAFNALSPQPDTSYNGSRPVKSHYYSQHAVALRAELGGAISRQQMRELHEKTAVRHLLVAARQFAILALATWGLIRFENPLIWVPLAFVQGFTVFNFTVLLHEVVHHTIFARRRPAAERALGYLYAIPSGISASQFTRWHLDHHAELGSDEDDPKRAHLSPKKNKRWYKLLYCTPALFPIYFRAARREASTYPEALRRLINRERKISMSAHGPCSLIIATAGMTSTAPPMSSVRPRPFNRALPLARISSSMRRRRNVGADVARRCVEHPLGEHAAVRVANREQFPVSSREASGDRRGD